MMTHSCQHWLLPCLHRLLLQLVLLITLLHTSNSFAQSQSDIKSRKILSITTLTNDTRKGDTIFRKNISRYDAHGNVVESIDYDSKGNMKEHEQFRFNRQDNEVGYVLLSPDENVLKKTETKYNKWRSAIEKISYDADGNVIERTIYTYNPSNDVISEITTGWDGRGIRKTLYDYDNRGMLISKKMYNEKGELVYSRNYSIEY